MKKIKEKFLLLKNKLIMNWRFFFSLRKEKWYLLKKVNPYYLKNYFKIIETSRDDISFYNKVLKTVLIKNELEEFIECRRLLDKKEYKVIFYGDFFSFQGSKFINPEIEYDRLKKRYVELLWKIESLRLKEKDGDEEFIFSMLFRIKNEVKRILIEIAENEK